MLDNWQDKLNPPLLWFIFFFSTPSTLSLQINYNCVQQYLLLINRLKGKVNNNGIPFYKSLFITYKWYSSFYIFTYEALTLNHEENFIITLFLIYDWTLKQIKDVFFKNVHFWNAIFNAYFILELRLDTLESYFILYYIWAELQNSTCTKNI